MVLWDLDRAEKLAVVQHRAPVSSLTLTGDPDRFFAAGISNRLRCATVGPLFVNISIGGTLTAFAAPPGRCVGVASVPPEPMAVTIAPRLRDAMPLITASIACT